ncbi:MAG: TonB-dependent receptor plug domain-containing protein [Janthinobacterium lividum]
MQKILPGISPLKALQTLPGVTFLTADPWGNNEQNISLFIHGFNQQQLGYTLDGLPLGDQQYGNYNGLSPQRAIISEDVGRVTLASGGRPGHAVDEQSRRHDRHLLERSQADRGRDDRAGRGQLRRLSHLCPDRQRRHRPEHALLRLGPASEGPGVGLRRPAGRLSGGREAGPRGCDGAPRRVLLLLGQGRAQRGRDRRVRDASLSALCPPVPVPELRRRAAILRRATRLQWRADLCRVGIELQQLLQRRAAYRLSRLHQIRLARVGPGPLDQPGVFPP